MTRYAKRTDANHAEIRDALRQMGFSVRDTSGIGNGYPDLTVTARAGRKVFLEIKVPGEERRLTAKEREWQAILSPDYHVVTTVEEAMAVCGLVEVARCQPG